MKRCGKINDLQVLKRLCTLYMLILKSFELPEAESSSWVAVWLGVWLGEDTLDGEGLAAHLSFIAVCGYLQHNWTITRLHGEREGGRKRYDIIL